MSKDAELDEATNRLAERFENNIQVEPECEAAGWGQFLDNPKAHLQVGPYGTSAGLIVLALACRGLSRPVTEARRLLRCWWDLRTDPNKREHQLYAQNLRLALQHLAIRLSAGRHDCDVAAIRDELLSRIPSHGLWGNYWTNESKHDATPRIFPSAMAILSFTLFVGDDAQFDQKIYDATDQLESKFLISGLSVLERVAITAALIATKGDELSGPVRRRIGQLARSLRGDLGRQELYFFDFEFLPDERGRIYSRDYFIVSPEILLAIAGYQPGAPTSLRLMAENTVTGLIHNLKQNDDAYKSKEGSRISTMDQAWVAVLLQSAKSKHAPPTKGSRLLYGLLRDRKENWFTGAFLPATLTLIIIVFNVALNGAGLVARITSAVALAVVTSIYGPRYLRRLFLGEESTDR